MSNCGNSERSKGSLPVTELRLGPGDFPLGSLQSRAAARAVMEQKGRPVMRFVIEYIGSARPPRIMEVPLK